MSTLIDNNIIIIKKNHFRAKYYFVCIPLRNFMGAPAPGAPMLPTPAQTIQNILNVASFSMDSLCLGVALTPRSGGFLVDDDETTDETDCFTPCILSYLPVFHKHTRLSCLQMHFFCLFSQVCMCLIWGTAYQSARRGHVFHTFSYSYRKYVIYFSCHAMMMYTPRASALRERQTYAHSW